MPKIKSKKRRRYDDKQLRHVFPVWLTLIYGVACGFLIPWTIFLSYVLPPHYVSGHWDVAWAGFDIFEALLFALTALLAIRRSSWTALSASMLGAILLIDAWFDVLTSKSGQDQHTAILEALFVELPLAVLSFALAHRSFNYVRRNAVKS